MIGERRGKVRTKVGEICYIQIGPNNGGVVLDISEEGLSFQAAGPVQETGQVLFSFLSFLRGRVDAAGEIIWKSTDKKSGGLRFMELSAAAQECVGELIPSLSRKSAKEEKASSSAGAAIARDSAGSAAEKLSLEPPPSGEEQKLERVVQLGSSSQSSFRSNSSVLGLQQHPEAPLLEEFSAARRQGFLRGLMTGIAITAILAAALWIFRDQLRQLAAPETAQTYSPADKPVPPASETAPPPVAALNDSRPVVPSAPAAAPPVQAPALEPAPSASESSPPNSAPNSQSPEADARGRSDAAPSPPRRVEKPLPYNADPSSAQTEERLWAAVREGNTEAEIELSDLYLRGDGVKKNCEQARILLLAAANKGSSIARDKLDTVNRTGCKS